MLAKLFFFVCGGLLCLAFSYHLGAQRAEGQSTGAVVAADDPGLGSFAVTSNADVYFALYSSEAANSPHWTRMGRIPTSSSIVHIEEAGGTYVHAFAADGGFFVSPDNGATWTLKGYVVTGATAAQRDSWGQVKVGHR